MRLAMLRPRTKAAVVASMAIAVGSLAAGPASASTTIGSAFPPSINCGANFTFVQNTPAYTVPAAGVITSWSVQTVANPAQLRFKVFRPAGGTAFTVIGASEPVTPAASSVTSRPIRVQVKAGDIIGESTLTAGTCGATSSNIINYISGDSAPGSTLTYASTPGTLSVAAVLEADADGDGFGDESQDACPSQATAGAACDLIAPDTRITAGQRTSFSGKVSYLFTATDAAARFECRLEGGKKKLGMFRPCASPAKYKHLKPGKYKFFVRAIDTFDNTDHTPAHRKLKVRLRP